MSTDREQLDDAIRRFLGAKAEIETLSQKIAEENCPLKVGDHVTILDGAREYEGIVNCIGHTVQRAALDPIVGEEIGWTVGGQRINKGNREESKWTFSITSFFAKLDDGKWLLTHQSVEELLGLA